MTKEDFQLLSKNKARQIIRKFVTNNELLEKLVVGIDEDFITGHILKDIMCTNFSFETIKIALEKKLQELKTTDASNAMSILLQPENQTKEDETDKEKKKRIGTPADDIEKLLKECQSEEAMAKMKEHDIDQEQFWELSKDDFKTLLGIKIYGRLEKLLKKFNKVKKEHEKKMEEKKDKGDTINKEGLSDLLKIDPLKSCA